MVQGMKTTKMQEEKTAFACGSLAQLNWRVSEDSNWLMSQNTDRWFY